MFSSFFGLLVGVPVVLLVVGLLFNATAVKRLFGFGRAQAGKLGRWSEKADPLAMMEQAVEDGVRDIEQARHGLEESQALVKSFERRVQAGREEQARLEHRIQNVLQAGDPNKSAAGYALQLADCEKALAGNQAALERHKANYATFSDSVQAGQRRVLEARRKCQSLGIELKQSERERKLGEFAHNFQFDPEALNSGMARAEELVQERIDSNRAAGDVALSLAPNKAEAADDELDRQAEAAKVLERFKTRTQADQTAPAGSRL